MAAVSNQESKSPAGGVRRADDAERRAVAGASATEIQILLGPADGAPNFAIRRFTMGPGGGMPVHTNQVEHEQFVLRGRAAVGIGTETFQVSAGDVLYIPAGVPHYYRVEEAPFEFLCMVPNAQDKIEILGKPAATTQERDKTPC